MTQIFSKRACPYYLKDNITDITCLTHEVSHYFASKIKTNHHFKTFFVEFEAKLMEYLMINYIMSKLNDKELGFTLMQDEINNIITDIHISFYQKLVANTLTNKYDEVKIQKRFKKQEQGKKGGLIKNIKIGGK